MATKNQWETITHFTPETITHFTPDEFDHADLISYRLLLQLDSQTETHTVATKNQWETITHFTPDEFDHPDLISYRLLLQLDSLRNILKKPLHISSDIRQTSSTSTHAHGNAVDLVCRNTTTRYEIVQAALRVGFLRIGVYDRHIHLDIGAPDKITPALWTGISK